MSPRAAAGAAVLAGLATVLAGCGGGGGTITIGAARPPAPALASAGPPPVRLHVGPGPVSTVVSRDGYRIHLTFAPNRATAANRVTVAVRDAGGPVPGARVSLDAGMLDMDMGVARYELAAAAGGYRAATPAWQMTGDWGLAFTIAPPGRAPIRVVLDDRIS